MEYDALEKNLETREILQEIVRVFPGFEKVHDISKRYHFCRNCSEKNHYTYKR